MMPPTALHWALQVIWPCCKAYILAVAQPQVA